MVPDDTVMAMNRNGHAHVFWQILMLFLCFLTLNGCLTWQAKKVVQPQRLSLDQSEQAIGDFLSTLEADGLSSTHRFTSSSSNAGIFYRRFNPAQLSYEYRLDVTPDRTVAESSIDTSMMLALDCEETHLLVFIHGLYTDSRLALIWIPSLVEQCFTVIAPDLRAHGQSGGQWSTFGVLETGDLLALIQHLEAEHEPDSISLLGISLGGTLALKLSAAGLELARTVALAPFERGDNAIRRTIPELDLWYTPSASRVEKILRRSEDLAGFQWQDTAIQGELKSPAILIAAENDEINPPEVVCGLAELLDTDCRIIPDLDHKMLLFPSDRVLDPVIRFLNAPNRSRQICAYEDDFLAARTASLNCNHQ